jgi:alpha-glucosidase
LLLTLRGTPTLYYGDEIGMVDVPIPPELVQDPCGKNLPGYGMGRDPERTPMQWDAGPAAGFTPGRPWLPVAPDYPTCNVAAQRNDPTSMLTLYRRLLQLRARHPALHLGEYVPVEQPVEQVMAYVRRSAAEQFLVAINFRPQPCDVPLAGSGLGGRVRLSTHLDRDGEHFAGFVRLRGDEAVVVELGENR